MSIRHLSYLACDFCLELCDGSDSDDAKDARAFGRRYGWKRLTQTRYSKALDICPECQKDPTRQVMP